MFGMGEVRDSSDPPASNGSRRMGGNEKGRGSAARAMWRGVSRRESITVIESRGNRLAPEAHLDTRRRIRTNEVAYYPYTL